MEDKNNLPEKTDLESYLDEVVGKVDDLTERLDDIDFDAELSDMRDAIDEKISKVEKKIKQPETKIIEGPPGPRGLRGYPGQTPTQAEIQALIPDPIPGKPGKDGEAPKLKDIVKEIQPFILSHIPQGHGGNMNRKETFAGVDRLTRYTDINWKPGTNVTFNIANNDQTKMVDVTITASGGGGGGGLTRSIQSISASQAADAAAATDYVYLCSGTMTLTMPDATSGNTNLYTIKNVGVGTVTVATTGGQTIDGSATASLPVRYTSIDLESDTANWNVT